MPDRCAPTTAMRDLVRRRRGGQPASGGCGTSERAERQPGVGVKRAAERGQQRVAARRARAASRRTACRRRASPAGTASAAQIEQVDEVGVGAEPAVEPDRIGQHLLDACRPWARSARISTSIAPNTRVAHAAQLLEPVERRERIDGASAARRCTMIVARRPDGSRPARASSVCDRDVALGHPRPLVEQPRGLVERRDSRSRRRRAERRAARDRALEGACRQLRRRRTPLASDRHADAHAVGEAPARAERPVREYGSAASGPAMTSSAATASSAVSAKIETQSSDAAGGHDAGGRDQRRGSASGRRCC